MCLSFPEGLIKELGDISYIFHVAAESHVDNSISDPVPFVQNNINSTLHILEYAKSLKNLEKFIYFSTDEVYGSAPVGIIKREKDLIVVILTLHQKVQQNAYVNLMQILMECLSL